MKKYTDRKYKFNIIDPDTNEMLLMEDSALSSTDIINRWVNKGYKVQRSSIIFLGWNIDNELNPV